MANPEAADRYPATLPLARLGDRPLARRSRRDATRPLRCDRDPDRGERYDVLLTNPPFGTKGANQAPDRDDFTIETNNKQLNF
ncbi:MAG TPA: hypothetical protein PKK20_12200, partial [Verrucomicrobiota bacterium]|nr:hypothetical protein [Verrucomicrobiota bacterium]